jgi:hypothetical protein
MIGWLVNNNLVGMCKEVSLSELRYDPWICAEELRNVTKTLQYEKSVSRSRLEMATPEFENRYQFSQLAIQISHHTVQGGSSGNDSGLYSGGARFDSQPERLSWPISCLVFLSPDRQKPRSFRCKSFSQFCINQSCYHSMMCAPDTERV